MSDILHSTYDDFLASYKRCAEGRLHLSSGLCRLSNQCYHIACKYIVHSWNNNNRLGTPQEQRKCLSKTCWIHPQTFGLIAWLSLTHSLTSPCTISWQIQHKSLFIFIYFRKGGEVGPTTNYFFSSSSTMDLRKHWRVFRELCSSMVLCKF